MKPFVLAWDGKSPTFGERVFVAPNATLIGEVHLDDDASVWFGAVLRADMGPIRIGKRTNIQDGACVHMTEGVSDVRVGDDVTVGHGAILHGCVVENACLVGMGAILLDGCRVGEGSVIAAGALVPPRVVIPPGSLVKGNPGKVVRPAEPHEQVLGRGGAVVYVGAAARYRALLGAHDGEGGTSS